MMNDQGDLREDLKLPDGDIGVQIKNDFENGRELLVCKWNVDFFRFVLILTDLNFEQCTVLKACGEECVIAVKANTAADK